jgi:hypothetical protein
MVFSSDIQIEVDDPIVVEIESNGAAKDHLGMCRCVDDFRNGGWWQCEHSHSRCTGRERVRVNAALN